MFPTFEANISIETLQNDEGIEVCKMNVHTSTLIIFTFLFPLISSANQYIHKTSQFQLQTISIFFH
jgi:hypothetical protein